MNPNPTTPSQNITLTGPDWHLALDENNLGRDEHWFEAVRPEARPAPVPGIVQQVFPQHQGVAWYWHAFTPARLPETDERCLLRFGAVEYLAEVWLNRHPAGGHEQQLRVCGSTRELASK